ncbi:aldo/keto reductase [Micromonospora sp. WMMD558]|uniref:aldo/keto reductase n=1 Tax=Micromonospora sp. WMMD558 TaxID=3403462 RepID=UPI003BF578AA
MTSKLPTPAFLLTRPTRRGVLTAGLAGVGMLAAGITGHARAAHAAPPGLRTLGRTGERLPAIGLALTSLGGRPAQRSYLRNLVKAYWEAGGRVIDTSGLSGDSELAFYEVATGLGIAGKMFLTQPLRGDDRQLRAATARLRREQIDLLHVGDLADTEAAVPLLRRWKTAGTIRYVGVGHQDTRYYPAVEILMRNAGVDVVQVRYSILTRTAEEHILPLAAERGIGVIVTMPTEESRLHQMVAGSPVPGWAADFGATTWTQFFLKYVLAHPAVTVALPPAGSPEQVTENMRALQGPLPDEGQKARMIDYLAATV